MPVRETASMSQQEDLKSKIAAKNPLFSIFGKRLMIIILIIIHKNYTGFQSNKESITNSVFSHTKHSQINNLHIFTIVFHFRQTLFLHDLLIHSFYPFHISDHHLAKGLSLSSVHDFGIHYYLPIPEIRILYQLSVPGSKHTCPKLHSLPRLFPISLDCLPRFW